jgi:hypothetical protein
MLDSGWRIEMDAATFENLEQGYRTESNPASRRGGRSRCRSSARARTDEGGLGADLAKALLALLPAVRTTFDLLRGPNVDPLWAAP